MPDDINTAALDAIRDYLKNPSEDKGKVADRGLKYLSRANSMDGIVLKRLSLQLQFAKLAGLRGEALKPVLAELSLGPSETKTLPAAATQS